MPSSLALSCGRVWSKKVEKIRFTGVYKSKREEECGAVCRTSAHSLSPQDTAFSILVLPSPPLHTLAGVSEANKRRSISDHIKPFPIAFYANYYQLLWHRERAGDSPAGDGRAGPFKNLNTALIFAYFAKLAYHQAARWWPLLGKPLTHFRYFSDIFVLSQADGPLNMCIYYFSN